mgnify:CR=1 FL=1
MSNSKLVDYTKISPHRTSPRQGKIRGISIHTMAGPGSVEGCGEVFQTSEASSHYGIRMGGSGSTSGKRTGPGAAPTGWTMRW